MKLSTTHSASSYGTPVFIDSAGNLMDYNKGIKELRRLMGWTSVKPLAKKIGFSPRTVEGWEQGRKPPKTALISMKNMLEQRI